jgi:O-antigen ligase
LESLEMGSAVTGADRTRAEHQANDTQLQDRAAFVVGAAFALACASFLIEFSPDGLSVVIFETRMIKWLSISVVTAAAIFFVAIGVIAAKEYRPGLVDLAVGLFVLWALISVLWTPDQLAFSFSALHITQMLAVFLFVRVIDQRSVKSLIEGLAVFGVVASLVLISLDLSDGFDGGFGNENFAAEFLTISTVLLSALTIINWHLEARKRTLVYAVVAAAGLVYLLILAPSNLQFLGFAGAATLALWWLSRRLFAGMVVIAALGIIAIVLLAPEFADELPRTFRDRAQIWVNASLLAVQAPITGHGLGSFFHLYPSVQDRYVEVAPFLGAPAFDNFLRNAPASENEFLQVFAELGGIGLLFAIGVLATAVSRMMRLPFVHVGVACGVTLASAVALSLVSFPMQNPAPALVAVVMLAVGAGMGAKTAEPYSERRSRLPIYGVAVASAIVTVLLVPPLQASWAFAHAEAYDGLRDKSAATRWVLRTLEHSSLDPRWRLRAFNQAVIDPERASLDVDLDNLFAVSSSAAPQHPLLLDLRLKQLLSTRGLVLDLDEIEGMLGALMQSSGRSRANAHILEAQLALQLGDRPRAVRAVTRARSLIGENLKTGDETNLINLEGLERQLGIKSGQGG